MKSKLRKEAEAVARPKDLRKARLFIEFKLELKLLSFPAKRKTLPKSRAYAYYFPQIIAEKVTDFRR